MLYRKMGKTDEDISILGFGCMRLPVIEGDNSKIDEELAIKQIRHGIDNGINYIDTAYPYHGGMSELIVAKALKDGYREKVKIATKLPSWLIKTREDMDKFLDEQLQKLETDSIDFYLLHALNEESWNNYLKLDVFDFIEKALSSGKIKHIGFSFHDELPVFKKIVDAYNWDFCQIQYNILDEEYQAGTEGLKYAADKGMGIIIMEPLRGGTLTKKIPEDVKNAWNSIPIKRSPASWCLRFLWDKPEITLVLSGMGEISQISENIDTASEGESNSLSDYEVNVINTVKDIYKSRIKVNCTNCKYCMPCPFGVDIPSCFRMLNEASMFENIEGYKKMYEGSLKMENRADVCKKCGKCEKACPQHIEIRKMLDEVKETFK